MTKITKEELLKIARISHIQIHEQEIEPLMKQVESVLTYAQRVKEIAAEIEETSSKEVNVFREDVVVKTDSELILQQAPEREYNYFVVPKILDSNE